MLLGPEKTLANYIKPHKRMLNRMKNTHKFPLTALCFLLITFVNVSAIAPPIIEPYGSLRYRTINVDGDPGDWTGIPPIITDPPFDGNNELEDIKAVYSANDEENLYFLMELHYLNAGSIDAEPISEGEYSFYIDIIPGGDPDTGADFQILHRIEENFNPGVYKATYLRYYDGVCWIIETSCSGVQGNSTTYFIEVSVPWACIEGQACFNCYFSAHYTPPTNDSDYAPNKGEGPVLLGCCPGYLPVGGEIMPYTLPTYLIPVLMLAAFILVTFREKISKFFLGIS